jgi:hypothetical protein
MAATLDLQLLPDFGDADQECIEWDFSGVDILQEDDNALAERLDSAVKCGRISRNEARAQQDLPPIGDDGSPMRKAFDTPQPLTANGFPWDPLPEWAPEPEPPPVPGTEGGMPESSGDAQAQAERPAPAQNGAKALPMPAAVRIDTEDVKQAEVLWDETMPEAAGILSARPANVKRGRASMDLGPLVPPLP